VEITKELAVALEHLYAAFAEYVRPASIVGCGCCWSNGVAAPASPAKQYQGGTVRVTSPGGRFSPRDADADQLRQVADLVPHLGGDVDVLRHYLPRLLEIAVSTGFDWPDVEPLMHRMSYGPALGSTPLRLWPTQQRAAIDEFSHVVWASRLAQLPNGYGDLSADTLLCAIAGCVDDVAPLLDHWLTFTEPYAAHHLAEFLNDNHSLRFGRLSNAFWTGNQRPLTPNLRTVVRWALAGTTQEAVMRASDRARTEEESMALQSCFDALEGTDAFAPGPLERAWLNNDLDALPMLIADGANPNELDPISQLPLWQVAFLEARYDAVRLLDGARLDHNGSQRAPLIFRLIDEGATQHEIAAVISLGADVTQRDNRGRSALEVAAAMGLTDIVTAIVVARTDPKLTAALISSATEIARRNGHTDCVSALTKRRSSANTGR
jgi:hypothetical protein